MSVPAYLRTNAVSHGRRVCQLYRNGLRNIQALVEGNRISYRYNAVLLRARFDANKNVADVMRAKELLKEGERELFVWQAPQPLKFPHSPSGTAYEREITPPDWVLDAWHPVEKSQYPEYFARRDVRKREFIERWNEKYGSPNKVVPFE